MHIQVWELVLKILPDNQLMQYGVDVMVITQHSILQDIKKMILKNVLWGLLYQRHSPCSQEVISICLLAL